MKPVVTHSDGSDALFAAWTCNMKCSDNAFDICGGPGAITLYKSKSAKPFPTPAPDPAPMPAPAPSNGGTTTSSKKGVGLAQGDQSSSAACSDLKQFNLSWYYN
jgi:hypothetical protein